MYEIDIEKIEELSADFLKEFITYWNGLTNEKQAGYFLSNESIIASKELIFSHVPLEFRLRILRLDRSLPPRAVAEVASHGIKVSIMAFRVTEELKHESKYIKDLIEAYNVACRELYYEIWDYV